MDHQLSLRWCLWPPEKRFPALQGPTRLGGSDGDESTYNAGELSLIPEFGRSFREGNDNPLLYSCLENRGAWWATVHGVAESDTTERLSLTLPKGSLQMPVFSFLSVEKTLVISKH